MLYDIQFFVLKILHAMQSTCVMTYAFPCVCNMSASLFSALTRVETRASKMIGVARPNELLDFCIHQCERLFQKVVTDLHHPLCELFEEPPVRARSDGRLLKAPVAKTERHFNIFIRFAR